MNPDLLKACDWSRLTSAATLIILTLLPGRLAATDSPVAISENETAFTLNNGLVAVRASKFSGDLLSLKYHGLEMLNAATGRQSGYWSHDTQRGRHLTAITIDPKTNGGERGEVSIKGVYNGTPLGSGPGGSVAADVEIRYCLGRGDSGVYTYSIFEHKTNYPATSVGEARFCVKLNDELFDWMTVDAKRNQRLITAYDWNHGTVMNFKEARRMTTGLYQGQVEHKYDYAANQFDVRAGLVQLRQAARPLVCEPLGRIPERRADQSRALRPPRRHLRRQSHRPGSADAAELLAQQPLWRQCLLPRPGRSLDQGHWPVSALLQRGKGRGQPDAGPQALWQDALARAARETESWPFGWVAGVDYPHRSERGTLRGRLVLDDPQAPNAPMTRLLVGLSAPESVPAAPDRPGGGFGRSYGPRTVNWQNDAKHYQFWTLGGANGAFAIPHIRPGTYTLHAIADGTLGEFTLTNVTLAAGQTLELGQIHWTPLRFGRQLWDVGIPNRSGAEFFKGDDYCHWGWYIEYPKLFPNDVNYVVGQSRFQKDWFFEQVPHSEDPADTTGKGGRTQHCLVYRF